MTSSTSELENASSQIINAINKCSEQNFKRMTEIMTEYAYSSYFFYGLDPSKTASGSYECADPRRNEDYQLFASKNQVQKWFVYYNSTEQVLNAAHINKVIDFFNQEVDVCIAYIKDIRNSMKIKEFDDVKTKLYESDQFKTCKTIMEFYAGLIFWGKYDAIKNVMGNKSEASYTFTNAKLQTIKEAFNNTYTRAITSLCSRTANDKEIEKYNAGFYINECSFASEGLAAEYEKNKVEYQAQVDKLFDVLRSTNELTLCYNRAIKGSTSYNVLGSERTQFIDNTTITQILSCCKEEQNKVLQKMEELTEKNNVNDLAARTEALEKSIAGIRNLFINITDDPEELAKLNEILDGSLIDRTREIEESINILNISIVIIFIILFVLFMVVIGGFSIMLVKFMRKNE